MEQKADAVFEGGGVKGIGLAGALFAMEEAGYRWVNVAGTSAGAIIASLIAVGYNAEEIKDIIMNIDYESFNDKTILSKIPLVGAIASIIFQKGIFCGDALEKWLREKYIAKGKIKFRDIRTQFNEEQYMYKLRVICSDISQKRLLILPQDIRRYGMDPDELDIAMAVRMSISIPLYYKPVTLTYYRDAKMLKSFIVDGGLLSNFPVWLFDSKGIPEWPTIGFKLVEPEFNPQNEKMNTVKYILNIISTMMEAFDQRYIETSNFNRTISIPTLGIGTTEFNITREKSMELFNAGYDSAKKFLSEWNFNRYINDFRRKN